MVLQGRVGGEEYYNLRVSLGLAGRDVARALPNGTYGTYRYRHSRIASLTVL